MRWLIVDLVKKILVIALAIIALPWIVLEFIAGFLESILGIFRNIDYDKLYNRIIITLYRIFGFKSAIITIGRNHFRGSDQLSYIIANNDIKCIVIDNHFRNDDDLYCVTIITTTSCDIHLIKVLLNEADIDTNW